MSEFSKEYDRTRERVRTHFKEYERNLKAADDQTISNEQRKGFLERAKVLRQNLVEWTAILNNLSAVMGREEILVEREVDEIKSRYTWPSSSSDS